MKTISSRLLALSVFAALLAGCGGGSAGSSIPNNASVSASSGSQAVTLSVLIPASTGTQSTQRSPRFLPTSTASLAVVVMNGSSTVTSMTIDTTSSSKSCTTGSSGRTCTGTVAVAPGSYTFQLTAKDQSGNTLSTGSVPSTIKAGQSNTVAVSLGGIVKSLSINPTAPNAVFEGVSSGSVTATITALDADSDTIVGSFGNGPITVSGAGIYKGTSGSLSSSSDTITINYSTPDPYTQSSADAFTASPSGVTVSGPTVMTAANIAPGAVALWYDAADAATVVTSPSFIWKDRSGNGHDVTPQVAGNQPTTAANAIGSKPALVFQPNQALVSTTNGFPATGDYTIFAVAKYTWPDGPNTTGDILGGGLNATPETAGHGIKIEGVSGGDQVSLYEASDRASIPSDVHHGDPYRLMAMMSGTTATLELWGPSADVPQSGSPVTATGVTRTSDSSVIVNGYGPATPNSSGALTSWNSGDDTIGEIIVLSGAATKSQQDMFGAYLKAKWGLQY